MNHSLKAICWELRTSEPAPNMEQGLRVVVAQNQVGLQRLTPGNARPRWAFTTYGTAEEAQGAAVAATEEFEKEGGKLVVAPGEVMMHPAEADSLARHPIIPPSLRARIYTSLDRRTPKAAPQP